jgi:hypothetical protein
VADDDLSDVKRSDAGAADGTTSTASSPRGDKAEWDTSPLYEAPAGPDNVADGVVAIVNSVVAAFRSLRRRVAGWRASD